MHPLMAYFICGVITVAIVVTGEDEREAAQLWDALLLILLTWPLYWLVQAVNLILQLSRKYGRR